MAKGRGEAAETDSLVMLARSGDREAFSRIVKREMERVFAVTYRMTGNRDEALDLAQDTFVSAWEKIRQFRGEAKLSSWLHRIAVNKCLNHLARKENFEKAEMPAPLKEDIASVDAESEFRHVRLRGRVIEFMRSLPPAQRLAFELRFFGQSSFSEMAELTGVAIGTVKTNYRLALKKLREAARKKGWV